MEQEREAELMEGCTPGSGEGRKERIREEAKKLSEMVFSKETTDHLVRAGTEMLMAIDSMIPYDKIPPDVREHYSAAKRETLMLIRALLNAEIEAKKAGEEKKEHLEKIDLE